MEIKLTEDEKQQTLQCVAFHRARIESNLLKYNIEYDKLGHNDVAYDALIQATQELIWRYEALEEKLNNIL